MNGLIFLVEDAPEGGYTAHALEQSIVTEADDLETRGCIRAACIHPEREGGGCGGGVGEEFAAGGGWHARTMARRRRVPSLDRPAPAS